MNSFYCRLQTKLRKGNVFTSMRQEFCPCQGGGVCVCPQKQTLPMGRHPIGIHPLGRHPPGQTPPGKTPHGQTPLDRHPLGRHPPPPDTLFTEMATAADGMHPTGIHSCLFYYHLCRVGLFQNATIEERVSLLEIQVEEIEGDVTLLEGDVNFLFDETVIQDERLFSLEQTTDTINAKLIAIDDEFDIIDSQLGGEFKRDNFSDVTYEEN